MIQFIAGEAFFKTISWKKSVPKNPIDDISVLVQVLSRPQKRDWILTHWGWEEMNNI